MEGLLADLARRGHAVTLVDRDPDPPPGIRVVPTDRGVGYRLAVA